MTAATAYNKRLKRPTVSIVQNNEEKEEDDK